MTTILNASNSSGLVAQADTSGILQLQTASTAAVTIDASQNVGVGTASPASKLTVSSTVNTLASFINTTTTAQLDIGAPTSNAQFLSPSLVGDTVVRALTGNLVIGAYAAKATVFANTNAETMRIDSSGNVGIGTSSPSAPLQVNGTATATRATSGQLWLSRSNNTTQYEGICLRGGPAYDAFIGRPPNSDAITFGFDAGASLAEAMRIDASGNVGIGTTTTSTYKLNVATTAGAQLRLYATDVASSTTNSIDFWYLDGGGSPYNNTAIRSLSTANAGNGNLVFYTRPTSGSLTEGMRIDASGNVLVGTTSTLVGEKLAVTANLANYGIVFDNINASPNNLYLRFSANAPNNTTNLFLACNDNASNRLSIRSNGGIANFSANNVNLSDQRTKKDIQNAGSYLHKICAIPVRTFLYKDQADNQLNLGVIAQEVEAIAPELVSNDGFGETKEGEAPLKAIYQTDLQYALMKCIQEQQALITQLQADVAALKGAK